MNIYQHFREDERNFIDKAIVWRNDVTNLYTPKLTDFLHPREQHILAAIVGKNDEINFSLWGGTEQCERKRAFIYPSYIEPTEYDFQLSFFSIEYPKKFVTITHRDVLGSLMSLGMKREKFGDIIFGTNEIQLILAEEIASYVELNLETIGQARVKLKPIAKADLLPVVEEWTEAVSTVSSLRLDTVLAKIYNVSRSKIIPYVEKGLVKVNWKTVEQSSFPVEEGDHFSVRGFGRSRLIAIDGLTKKGKYKVRYGKKR